MQTDLNIDGFVKVLMFLDESLYAVQGVPLIIAGQESLTCCHPVFSLLAVTVEQLQEESKEC